VYKNNINVLLIEDNPGDARLIKEILSDTEEILFKIEWVNCLSKGLQRLVKGNIKLILLNLSLPDSRGLETIRCVHAQAPEIPIVVMTGLNDKNLAMEALREGAQDYLIKDQVDSQLLERCMRYAIERHRTEIMLRSSLKNMQDVMDDIIYAMARMVEIRDPYTAGHQKRVADLAYSIALQMTLPEEKTKAIHFAAIIHDIGKINIPFEILSKPDALDENESRIIKSHPAVGHGILKTINFPWPIAEIILQHHERMNGTGYPKGLSGENILLEARILGVADTVEAMSSHRPYRPALGITKALDEIINNRGILYDSDVVTACITVFTEKGYHFIRGSRVNSYNHVTETAVIASPKMIPKKG